MIDGWVIHNDWSKKYCIQRWLMYVRIIIHTCAHSTSTQLILQWWSANPLCRCRHTQQTCARLSFRRQEGLSFGFALLSSSMPAVSISAASFIVLQVVSNIHTIRATLKDPATWMFNLKVCMRLTARRTDSATSDSLLDRSNSVALLPVSSWWTTWSRWSTASSSCEPRTTWASRFCSSWAPSASSQWVFTLLLHANKSFVPMPFHYPPSHDPIRSH